MYASAGSLMWPTRSWTALSAGSSRSRLARAACPPYATCPSVAGSRGPPAQPPAFAPRRSSTAARSAGDGGGAMTCRSIGPSVRPARASHPRGPPTTATLAESPCPQYRCKRTGDLGIATTVGSVYGQPQTALGGVTLTVPFRLSHRARRVRPLPPRVRRACTAPETIPERGPRRGPNRRGPSAGWASPRSAGRTRAWRHDPCVRRGRAAARSGWRWP